MSHTVTQRYAKTFFDLSLKSNALDMVRDDFKKMFFLIGKSSDLEEFLHNPIIPRQKRLTILEEIFKKRFGALTYQFILFLNEKKRLNYLKDICCAFEQLYLDNAGILTVNITSHVALNTHQRDDITQHLKTKFGMEIQLSTAIEKDMIGGIKIQQGDTIFDYSFK